MHQTAKPTCQTCRMPMEVDRIMPCAADYDMWTYRCSVCASAVLMVEARMEDRASVDERRDVVRYLVTTPATIEFGSRAIVCTVRDVSATGAALNLAGCPRLPKKFTLSAAGSALPCRAVWRKGKRIGIAFN